MHACSGPSRSPIPAQADHRFRSKPITDSGASRSPIPAKPITPGPDRQTLTTLDMPPTTAPPNGGARVGREAEGQIWALSAGQWTALADAGFGLEAIWGSGPNDLVAVGEGTGNGQPLIEVWDGGSLASVALAVGPAISWSGVWGVGSDEVFVSGAQRGLAQTDGSSQVAHFVDGGWTLSNLDVTATKVWGRCSSQVWAAGGGVARWNGTQWQDEPIPPLPQGVLGGLGGSATIVWAVGGSGLIYKLGPAP